MLSGRELEAGWRLSCQCRAEADLTLELAQWEAAILSDNAPFPFSPHEGLGVAVPTAKRDWTYARAWLFRVAGNLAVIPLTGVTFPFGTYLLRVAHGVPCAGIG